MVETLSQLFLNTIKSYSKDDLMENWAMKPGIN
jgi:hypothetical protein